MEPTNTATLPPESVPAAPATPAQPTGPQATPAIPQGTPEPQPGANGPVEPSVQPASSPPGTRVKPSEYVRQRLKIQTLERQLADVQRTMASQARTAVPNEPVRPAVDYNKKVWDDPVSVINELIKNALGDTLPKMIDERNSADQNRTNRQEALKLIFTNENVTRAGDEGYERIIQIMKDRGLDNLAQSDPLNAAQIALDLYASKYPAVVSPPVSSNPLAPKGKGQMASTQTGNAAAPNVNKEVSVDDLMTQLKAIKQEIIANPDLNSDEGIKARIAEIKKKLSEKNQ